MRAKEFYLKAIVYSLLAGLLGLLADAVLCSAVWLFLAGDAERFQPTVPHPVEEVHYDVYPSAEAFEVTTGNGGYLLTGTGILEGKKVELSYHTHRTHN